MDGEKIGECQLLMDIIMAYNTKEKLLVNLNGGYMNKIEGIIILVGSLLITFIIVYGSVQILGLEILYYG